MNSGNIHINSLAGLKFAIRGRGVRRAPGEMNKTEAQYADYLRERMLVGDIEHFQFDAVKLRLAPSTFYTPDFFVMRGDGTIEFHEVKGFMEDDAAVKIKVAATLWPFRFMLVRKEAKKRGGGWIIEEVEPKKQQTAGAKA